MKAYCYINKGIDKTNCDDRVLINNSIIAEGFYQTELSNEQRSVFAVADGVGGNKAGYYAASLAMIFMSESIIPAELSAENIEQRIIEVNQEIIFLSEKDLRYERMATTLSGICSDGKKWLLFHVGNTRVYIWAHGTLSQLTEDHTWVREMQIKGYCEEELVESSKKSVITACLGGGNESLIDQLQISDITSFIQGAKRIFITSDGIHDFIKHSILEASIERISDPYKYFQQAVEFARSEGSQDDISILMIDL